MDLNMQVVVIFTVGFALASLLGYISQRLRLPYILGYLLAGFIIGPFSPGYVANLHIAEQLAEIGVVLMLFGVGLHFKLRDLYNVKNIAIPGAIVQTLAATTMGTLLTYYLGWNLITGVVIGLSVAVASTVVLVRVLTDFHLLSTVQGHIAVGWLIVEDIFTIVILILLPMFATVFYGGEVSFYTISSTLAFLTVKFIVLGLVMFTLGHKVVRYILTNIARVRSHELFTLTVLALIFVIATGSAYIFGTSIALGAFIAGMVIGQTEMRHQALANSLSLKDVFAVVFFLSIGMLFNPMAIGENFPLFLGLLFIILIVKPIAAIIIVLAFKFPMKVALTVAIALAQIGEFSFILVQEALKLEIIPTEAFDIIIACALISISINPLLFRLIGIYEKKTSKMNVAKVITSQAVKSSSERVSHLFEHQIAAVPKVIIVGFGALGESICNLLEERGVKASIVEQNIDAVAAIQSKGKQVIFGDASQLKILEIAKSATAELMIITIPEINQILEIIKSAYMLNQDLQIIVRVPLQKDISLFKDYQVDIVCAEKEEMKLFVHKVLTSKVISS